MRQIQRTVVGLQNAPTKGNGSLLSPFPDADLERALKRPEAVQASEKCVRVFFNKIFDRILFLHRRNIGSSVLYVKKISATKVEAMQMLLEMKDVCYAASGLLIPVRSLISPASLCLRLIFNFKYKSIDYI